MHLLLFVFLLTLTPGFLLKPGSGEDIIKAMHDRYSATWYRSLTFTQKTVTHRPDGTTQEATWYEYMSIPGKLKIDFAPADSGNGMLFTYDSIFVYQRGALRNARPLLHALLVLGFDVYHASVEGTVQKLKALHYNLSIVHEDTWQGRPVYVVGAEKGDVKTKQFWIDKERLVFVRSLELSPRDNLVSEVQFNDYQKLGGGWVSPSVLFLHDGKIATEELYSEMKVDVKLDEKMFEPAR